MPLLQALTDKYASPNTIDQAIQISGKTVEEVGFEKIQQEIQDFQELKTIILDNRRISLDGVSFDQEKQVRDLEGLQLKVQELDLGQNLFETWTGILRLCAPLKNLRSLDLSCVYLTSRCCWQS